MQWLISWRCPPVNRPQRSCLTIHLIFAQQFLMTLPCKLRNRHLVHLSVPLFSGWLDQDAFIPPRPGVDPLRFTLVITLRLCLAISYLLRPKARNDVWASG